MNRVIKTLTAAMGAGAVLFVALDASAQPSASPAGAPAEARTAVDPAQLALAKRLMSLLTTQMNFPAMMNAMNGQLIQAMRQQMPDADPAFLNRFAAVSDKVEAEMIPDLMNDVAETYARHLTRQEMEDSIAFYQSPSGRSMMHKMPEIVGSMGPTIAKWVPRMRAEMAQAMCAGDACTPAQRQFMAALASPATAQH